MRTRGGAAWLALVLLSGCAVSLVRDGRIREEPFAEIVARTAAARGNPRPTNVVARVVDVDGVADVLRASHTRERTPEETSRYQERLVSIGLWPADRDLLEESLLVAREEVGGFYLRDTGVLYVVDDLRVPFSARILSLLLRRDLLREAVLTHELTHLLQHRTQPSPFDVFGWTQQDDAASAVQAAIEGDATHYGYLALLPPGSEDRLPAPGELRQAIQRSLAEREDGALAGAPGLLRLTLAFPYERGYPLSLEEGTVLLDHPPASTEQVLHGQRRNADFQVADLVRLEQALPDACDSLGQNTLGELGIWVLLTDLGAEDEADAAGDGWDGDRYVAARCGDSRAFFWWTAWDSEADAIEFENAYRRIAPAVVARAGLAGVLAIARIGTQVTIASEPLQSLAPALAAAAPRVRISSLDELRRHFGLASPAAPR